MAPKPSTAPVEQAPPLSDAQQQLSQAAAVQARYAQGDRNERPPPPQYDAGSKRYFFTSRPERLARLLGSPLAQEGKFAIGPNRERLVREGWGTERNLTYDKAPKKTFHKGLDFSAPVGEPVLACADGVVTSVSVHTQTYHGVAAHLPYALAAGMDFDPTVNAPRDIVNGDGRLFVLVDAIKAEPAGRGRRAKPGRPAVTAPFFRHVELGFGGIYIFITHKNDFAGYRTQYFHLSRAIVKTGDRVTEGQTIGYVGRSGIKGPPDKIPDHLHFEVAFVRGGNNGQSPLVNPVALVPHVWRGHPDSTNADDAFGVRLPPRAVAGVQIGASRAANALNAMNRATAMLNQDVAQLRMGSAAHADRLKSVLDVGQAGLYMLQTHMQGEAPTIVAPMGFDFVTGTWSDGKVV